MSLEQDINNANNQQVVDVNIITTELSSLTENDGVEVNNSSNDKDTDINIDTDMTTIEDTNGIIDNTTTVELNNQTLSSTIEDSSSTASSSPTIHSLSKKKRTLSMPAANLNETNDAEVKEEAESSTNSFSAPKTRRSRNSLAPKPTIQHTQPVHKGEVLLTPGQAQELSGKSKRWVYVAIDAEPKKEEPLPAKRERKQIYSDLLTPPKSKASAQRKQPAQVPQPIIEKTTTKIGSSSSSSSSRRKSANTSTSTPVSTTTTTTTSTITTPSRRKGSKPIQHDLPELHIEIENSDIINGDYSKKDNSNNINNNGNNLTVPERKYSSLYSDDEDEGNEPVNNSIDSNNDITINNEDQDTTIDETVGMNVDDTSSGKSKKRKSITQKSSKQSSAVKKPKSQPQVSTYVTPIPIATIANTTTTATTATASNTTTPVSTPNIGSVNSTERAQRSTRGRRPPSGDVVLTPQLKKSIELLDTLMNHEHSGPFLQPVDPYALNILDYFQIIKHPMDFGTIRSSLIGGVYRNATEFGEDVRLVFINAKTYNPPGNPVHIMAQNVEDLFDKMFPKVLQESSAIPTPTLNTTKEHHSGSSHSGTTTSASHTKSHHHGSGNNNSTDNERIEKLSNDLKIMTKELERLKEQQPQKPQPPPKQRSKPRYPPINKAMSLQEKKVLGSKLSVLPPALLPQVIEIIKPSLSNSSQQDEIEIDLDALDTRTLRTLEKFIDKELPSTSPPTSPHSTISSHNTPTSPPKYNNTNSNKPLSPQISPSTLINSNTTSEIENVKSKIEQLKKGMKGKKNISKPISRARGRKAAISQFKKDDDVIIDDLENNNSNTNLLGDKYLPTEKDQHMSEVSDAGDSSDSDSSDSDSDSDSSSSGSYSDFSDSDNESHKNNNNKPMYNSNPNQTPTNSTTTTNQNSNQQNNTGGNYNNLQNELNSSSTTIKPPLLLHQTTKKTPALASVTASWNLEQQQQAAQTAQTQSPISSSTLVSSSSSSTPPIIPQTTQSISTSNVTISPPSPQSPTTNETSPNHVSNNSADPTWNLFITKNKTLLQKEKEKTIQEELAKKEREEREEEMRREEEKKRQQLELEKKLAKEKMEKEAEEAKKKIEMERQAAREAREKEKLNGSISFQYQMDVMASFENNNSLDHSNSFLGGLQLKPIEDTL